MSDKQIIFVWEKDVQKECRQKEKEKEVLTASYWPYFKAVRDDIIIGCMLGKHGLE